MCFIRINCNFAAKSILIQTGMKEQLIIAAIVCFCFGACKNEKLAIAGSGWDEIAIINKNTGTIEWRHALDPGDECNKIEVTPEGHILFAYSKGAKLINRNHTTIWDYKANENDEIHSASRLKDGSFMIGICGEPARIVELDASGKQIKEITFLTLTFDIHNQFRQITKASDGTYLIPMLEKQKVMHLSSEGNNKGAYNAASGAFSVKVLNNNNLLVSGGNASRFIEIDPDFPYRANMLFTTEINGGVLRYVAEIILYKNGNKLIANSNMYSNDKSPQPFLLEIDAENNVVWSLPYNRDIKNITAVYSFFE